MSYKPKDRKTVNLFKELLPFGGRLNLNNRWIKLEGLVPWEELEEIYRKYFSHLGRPGKDSQLINGLLIVKHTKVLSDEDVVNEFLENPYIQYFCGYDQFVKEGEIESSTLCRMRKRLGKEYFAKFEREILEVLKDRKIIKSREQMVDATVFPANITYPTDTGLIENARQWVVKNIKLIIKITGIKEKIRTYCRKARATYLKFQKKRKKTMKEVMKAKKQALQYLRRNIFQLKEIIIKVKDIPTELLDKIMRRLEVVEKIYEQQKEMLNNKVNTVKDRIVSFHSPHIRPIKRGKSGKETEFGPKGVLSYVDGYAFLDDISFDAFNETNRLKHSIELHKERFEKKPDTMILDNIYGSRDNREMLRSEGIKSALIPLGRHSKSRKRILKWIKQKQKLRSRMEGIIGNSKNNYGLEKILYKIAGGEEIWVRMGLTTMNLFTALARI